MATSPWPAPIGGGGGLTAQGSGKVLLTAGDTYSGPTTASGGTLELDGFLVSTATVNNGALLSGTGSLPTVFVSLGGDLSPGDPGTGQLTVTGSATISGNLDIAAAGSSVTGLSVSGNLVLNDATLNVTGTLLPGTYTIASYGGTLSGDGFTTQNLPAGVSVNYGSGNDSQITLTAVPEPGTLALLGAGMAGVVCLRRRINGRAR